MSPTTAPARRSAPSRLRRTEQVRTVQAARPPLRVVDAKEVRGSARRDRPRRLPLIMALGMVVASLLAVVAGHAVLAQGQIRLTGVQSAIAGAQNLQRQEVLTVSMLEAPTRIVGEAQAKLHMTSPVQVIQVPAVSLSTPLPAPTVAATPPSGTSAPANTSAQAVPAYAPATPASVPVPAG